MVRGIDLSEFQNNVDYKKLKEQGIEYAILRCGFGKDSNQKDKMFETHYQGCKNAGIKVGAYLYSYCTAVENAKWEAQNCLNCIDGKQLDLPIFYDLEEQRTANLGRAAVTQIALEFCRIIESKGYKAGVYANLNWFKNYIDVTPIQSEGFKIWLAQWGVNKPTANFKYDFWQYTNQLHVANITCDGDYADEKEINGVVDNVENYVEKTKAMAVDVIYGKYGSGQERKNKLGKYYNDVQNIVNDIYKIVKG